MTERSLSWVRNDLHYLQKKGSSSLCHKWRAQTGWLLMLILGPSQKVQSRTIRWDGIGVPTSSCWRGTLLQLSVSHKGPSQGSCQQLCCFFGWLVKTLRRELARSSVWSGPTLAADELTCAGSRSESRDVLWCSRTEIWWLALIIVSVSSQVASFSHLLQSDLSASLSEQEGTQSEADHRYLQLWRLWPGVTHTALPAHLPKPLVQDVEPCRRRSQQFVFLPSQMKRATLTWSNRVKTTSWTRSREEREDQFWITEEGPSSAVRNLSSPRPRAHFFLCFTDKTLQRSVCCPVLWLLACKEY